MSLPLRQMVRRGELPRHRHAEAYVAVVLAGAYEEAGDRGRRRLTAGDVVIHAGWEAHLNRTSASAQVLNLPLDLPGLAPFGAIDDLDRLASLAERDLTAARDFLTQALRPRTASLFDWPELLADALASGERTPLSEWAHVFGVSAEHLSRGFRRVFGVTPQRFAWEARSRAVLTEIQRSATALQTRPT